VSLRFQTWAVAKACYEAMLLSDRRPLHRTVAETLESRAFVLDDPDAKAAPDDRSLRMELLSDRLPTEPVVAAAAELARNWQAAGEPRRAGLFLLLHVRDQNRAARSQDVAEQALRAKTWLLEGGDRLSAAAADLERGRFLNRVGRVSDALQVFRDAAEGFAGEDSPAADLLRVRLAVARGSALESTGRYDEAEDLFTGALKESRAMGSQSDVAVILRAIGTIHMVRGAYDPAINLFRESLEIARQTGDAKGVAQATQSIGAIRWYKGEIAEAFAAYRAAVEMQRGFANLPGTAGALNNIGAWHWSTGDFEQATLCHEQTLAIRRRMGDRAGEAASLNNSGIIHDARGDDVAALRCFEQSRAIRREIRDRRGEAVTTANIAWSRLAVGDAAAALAESERAVTQARELAVEDLLCESLATRSIARFRLGRAGEARTDATEAIALADKTGNAVERIWARVAMALATGALAPAAEALEIARKLGNPIYLCEALLCAAECAIRSGRSSNATGALEETEKLAKKVGAKGMLRRAEAARALAGR